MSHLWGIDLGGTKIEAAVLNPDRPTDPLLRKRVPTESHRGYEHIVGAIAGLIADAARELGIPRPTKVGIGTPGALEPSTGLIKNSNSTCLIGRPLQADLEAVLQAAVLMSNDANCFALAEATLGAAKGYRTVFGVIMGTGAGGGIVVDGKVLNGANGIAGEWGHAVLDASGPECYCGKRGCIETYLSGPSVERLHRERTGRSLPLREIAAQASSDPDSEATINEMCENFGRALAYVVNILDPDAIVLGGGAGQVPQLYTAGLESLKENAFTRTFATRLLAPALGDSAGVFGSAMLCG